MSISLADWSEFDEILPLVLKYKVGIEIQEFTSPDNIDHNGQLAKEFSEKIASISLRGFHGPFAELVPASWDPLVRNVARLRFESAYDLAQTVSAQHLILHTGYFPKTYRRETWIQNSFDFWVDFLRDKSGPPQVHIENFYEDDCSAIVELIDRVNEALSGEMLTSCLDIGHVNANSSKTLEQWITGLADRIRYVHLHNNDGMLDDHWGLWKGKIDIVRTLDLLKKFAPTAVRTVETIVSDTEPSIIWLQEKGYA